MPAHEVNFDGLVGPTHNYAGLSWGNLASQKNRLSVSNPRQAALQGLAKMKFMADLGLKQAILLPSIRPDLRALRRIGFGGNDENVLQEAQRQSPRILAACYSASSMWAANAATISPSSDSRDGRVHLTAANLPSQFHRSIETRFTAAMLKAIFSDPDLFVHHDPLPAGDWFCDEGAANHARLVREYGKVGVEIFISGRSAMSPAATQFPARQTREACEALTRLHDLDPAATIFLRQNPAAIDAGAFHNDVVAVGNQNVMLFHALAYENSLEAIKQMKLAFSRRCDGPLYLISASEDEISLADAVQTYLFNSQLVTLADGTMALIAPIECREHPAAQRFLQRVLEEGNPVKAVHYLDVRQSMQNGGGPACLRLRVVLNDRELSAIHPGVVFTDALHARLIDWVNRHYRERLHPDDLADPALLRESRDAIDELSRIVDLGSIYL